MLCRIPTKQSPTQEEIATLTSFARNDIKVEPTL